MGEAQTRKELIDTELLKCGWDINDGTKVVLEYEIDLDETLPANFNQSYRYVDYVLLNRQNKIIALVEAKDKHKSVEQAKSQAEYYARRIANVQGFTPFIYITNGLEIEFWDSLNQPIRKVLSYHSLEDLEWLKFRNENKQPLSTELLNKSIANRPYQIEAITKGLEAYDANKRSVLWVMATGTGKTRTIIAFIDILLRSKFIKRVLFLADRTALVKQALDNFKTHLPDQSRERITTSEFEKDKRIYASTYQTMVSLINKIDISQGFFDIIVADESHRSIYNHYGQVFLKFDALKMGLTATPVDFIDRDTYKFFNTDTGNPTFAYTYEEAIKAGYLVNYEVLSVKTNFLENGIRFEALSEEEQEKLRNSGFSEEEIDFEGSAVEKAVLNDDTNRQILKSFMENCHKDPKTNLPAKTIIFAINKKHAYRLVKLYDELFPEHNSKVAKVIVSEISNADELIKEFSTNDSGFNIAVSVDMLDTGIDVPSIMNLVFAKPVYSKAKFWQMIGRGTRLYENEYFTKEKFLILDFWGNFEYFKETPNGFEPTEQISVNRAIYNQNIQLLKAYGGEEFEAIKKEVKAQIEALPKEDFFIKQRRKELSEFNAMFWDNVHLNVSLLSSVSDLLDRMTSMDDYDLRFRLKVKKLQHAKTKEDDVKTIESAIDTIINDIIRLNHNISEVAKHADLIAKASIGAYWFELSFKETQVTTDILAPLMKYKSKIIKEQYHFDLDDYIASTTKTTIDTPSINLKEYEERISRVIQELTNSSPALQKLFVGIQLDQDDVKSLSDALLGADIDPDKLGEVYRIQSNDLIEIFTHILERKEYKLPHLLNQFIQTHSLNSTQIEFINAIKHYLSEKHDIHRKDLMDNPFTKFHKHGILGLFNQSLQSEIVDIIEGKME
jgi:type I restriction enzyme R subunit